MNYKKFLQKALEAGISTAEVKFYETSEINAKVFHEALDNYTISKQSSITARGIFNGKIGTASTEKLDNSAIDYLINSIKDSASHNEKEEKPIIFEGSKKYHKKNTYNTALENVDMSKKLKMLYEIEKLAYEANKAITDVEVSFEESVSSKVLANTFGLNLKAKTNYYVYVLEVIAKVGDETKMDYDIFLENDFAKFEPKKFVNKVVDNVMAKFNGVSTPSKKYKVVLNPNTTATFLNAMTNSGLSAEEVQKKSSLLVGKLNEKVFSSKVTIEEKPLTTNCFFTYFDDEGVATYNKRLVDKGVVKTYLYNLETAKKDNVASTGNGYGKSKIGIDTCNLTLKPGTKSEEELFAQAKEGIYITSVTGLHAGLNPQSGDFSLEAEGFLIKDGKKASALKLMTVGGNIYTLFNDVVSVGNNSELSISSVSAPSILVKGLKVSSL